MCVGVMFVCFHKDVSTIFKAVKKKKIGQVIFSAGGQ